MTKEEKNTAKEKAIINTTGKNTKNKFPNSQKIFQELMPRVKDLMDKEQAKTITEEEFQELRVLRELLFNQVIKFGFSQLREILAGRYITKDLIEGVKADLFIEFCSVLYKYDPEWTTPTTYFLRPFKGAISRHLAGRSGKTPYEIQNWKKVSRCINFYESIGEEWTLGMISSLSGLSPRVVQSTLEIKRRSELVDIDELYDLRDQRNKTPEEEYIAKEREELIYNTLKKQLTPEEYKLLELRLNLNSHKTLSFDRVAEQAGLSLKDTRSRLSNISVKLSKDPTLRKLFNICEEKQESIRNALAEDFPFEEDEDLDPFKNSF